MRLPSWGPYIPSAEPAALMLAAHLHEIEQEALHRVHGGGGSLARLHGST